MAKPLFIAATRQHVGKTTCSLAIMSGLQDSLERVGFIKPVGQQHVAVPGHPTLRVDKDVQLMKEFFGLDHVDYEDMSPVLVPRNYTKRYIDGGGGGSLLEEQRARIEASAARVVGASEATVLEGTGHVGVGSIIGVSNAEVAKLVGADVVLVANGGIGSAFDELEMNRIMLKDQGVRVRGVILNKVQPDKVDMVRVRAGKGCEHPNFKGSYLGRFPLASADFRTSDHLSERSRSGDGVSARRQPTLKRR